jgi:hypothetical protein
VSLKITANMVQEQQPYHDLGHDVELVVPRDDQAIDVSAAVEEAVVEATVGHLLIHEASKFRACTEKEHHVGVADAVEHLHQLLELQPALHCVWAEHLDGDLRVVKESLVHAVHRAYPPSLILRVSLNESVATSITSIAPASCPKTTPTSLLSFMFHATSVWHMSVYNQA